MKKNGECSIERIMEQKGDSACSFERIYFSRGSDKDIYKERKQLGEQLTQPILKAVDYDVDHTVFSYIPNTAEVAYYGMLSGFKKYLNENKLSRLPTRPCSIKKKNYTKSSAISSAQKR